MQNLRHPLAAVAASILIMSVISGINPGNLAAFADSHEDEFTESLGEHSQVTLETDDDRIDLEVEIEDGDLEDGEHNVVFECAEPEIREEFTDALEIEDGEGEFETEIELEEGEYSGCDIGVGDLTASFPAFAIITQEDDEDDEKKRSVGAFARRRRRRGRARSQGTRPCADRWRTGSGRPDRSDLLAVFQAGWSTAGLHFRIKVFDDDLYTATDVDTRHQDNIELVYFGLPPDQAESSGADNHQLYVSFAGRPASATSKVYDDLIAFETQGRFIQSRYADDSISDISREKDKSGQ